MKELLFVVALFTAFSGRAQNYTPIDAGSKLHFVIKNIGINTGGDVTGMKGKIKFDAKQPGAAIFDVTADVNTIDTDNGKRDEHLKKEEYFNAEKYPTIHIVSTEILKGTDLKNFIFKGNLTIKDITKQIEFPFSAIGKDGGAFFTGRFELNRIDFGIGKESFALADKVIVTLNVFAKAN